MKTDLDRTPQKKQDSKKPPTPTPTLALRLVLVALEVGFIVVLLFVWRGQLTFGVEKRLDAWVVFLGISTFIALAVTGEIFWAQLKTASAQLSASEQAERPWIGFVRIYAEPPIEEGTGKIAIAITNSGRTPAHILRFDVGFVLGVYPGVGPSSIAWKNPWYEERPGGPAQSILVPGALSELRISYALNAFDVPPAEVWLKAKVGQPILSGTGLFADKDSRTQRTDNPTRPAKPGEVLTNILSGVYTIYVHSRVIYKDVRTGEEHSSTACCYYHPKHRDFAYFSDYNAAD